MARSRLSETQVFDADFMSEAEYETKSTTMSGHLYDQMVLISGSLSYEINAITDTLTSGCVPYFISDKFNDSPITIVDINIVNIDGSIEIPADPESNNEARGIITTMTVDANTYGIGAALYLDNDGHWIEADAETAMPCGALALETGTGSKRVLMQGFIRNDNWNWSTIGGFGFIYVSCVTGELTQTAPSGSGDFVQIVGFATHANRMYFNPQYTMVEIV
jgi:hypothetical protein